MSLLYFKVVGKFLFRREDTHLFLKKVFRALFRFMVVCTATVCAFRVSGFVCAWILFIVKGCTSTLLASRVWVTKFPYLAKTKATTTHSWFWVVRTDCSRTFVNCNFSGRVVPWKVSNIVVILFFIFVLRDFILIFDIFTIESERLDNLTILIMRFENFHVFKEFFIGNINGKFTDYIPCHVTKLFGIIAISPFDFSTGSFKTWFDALPEDIVAQTLPRPLGLMITTLLG